MRTTNPWKLSTIALTLALGVVAGGSFVKPAAAEKEHEHEHGHGHMRAALEQLKAAKGSLEAAAHDFGGHRAKALDLTKKAITEVEEGIKFAEEHKGEGQNPKGGGQNPKGGGGQGQQPK